MQEKLILDCTMLAYALQNKRYTMELSNHTTFEYFRTNIQWLYKAIIEHFTNPKFKEIPTLNIIKEYLNKNYSQTEFINDAISTYNEIINLKIDLAEFTWHLDKLKSRYNDQVQRSCTSSMIKLIKDSSEENPEDRIDKINDLMRQSIMTIDTIYRREAYNEGSLADSAKDRARKYKEIEANPELAQGIMTGFSELDRITNGFHPGELIIIGGSTSTGKSVMMHNIAHNAFIGKQNPLDDPPDPQNIIDGHNILYFSLEMPKENQERRIDACMANIIANEIRDGKLSKEDKEKYFKVLKFQASYGKVLHVVDMPRGVTPREIELKYTEATDKYGCDFDEVFIDYLGLMKASTQKDAADWFELGTIAEELHEFARIYKVPVITATQLSKSKDPNKPQHSTDRIARSNMIPDNANIILQIACRGDDEYTRIDMPVYITKMRDGEKGSFTLTKDFAKMKVIDIVDDTYVNGDLDEIV